MPTLQEIINKRLELSKTNPNATNVDARRALTTTPTTPTATVQNAPVAGVAPQVTQPVAPTVIPEAKAGDTVIGVGGQKFTQANNKDMSIEQTTTPQVVNQSPATTTPTPTPTTPIPTTPTTPTDKTAEIKAQNEAQLALNKQQAEQRQAERDKATQEANNALASSESSILNTLRSGGVIPKSVKTSPYYRTAQQTYNKLQQFSTYSTSDLTTALNTGALLPGTSVYNEMLKDPAMKTKLTQAQIYTVGQPVDTTEVFSQVSNEILSNNPTTASYLDDGVITQEEYNQATNNADVVAKAKDVEEKTNKYNTLKAEYDAIEDEVNAQFPGSPYADSIIADRQKAKYKNLVLAKGEVDSAVGTLTEIKSQASALFETNLKLYETRRAEQTAREQAVFEANLGLQTKQAEADMAQQLARESMNDPYTAIPQMIASYQEMGIPFERSVQQIIQDFESSGQDLGTYLTGLQKLIQEKPEYKAMQARKAGEGVSYQTIGDTVYRMNPDGTLTPTNINPKSTTPDWKQDASGNWYDANSSVSPYSQTAGTPAGLLDYISASEGTNGNYNAMYGKGGQTDINLTGMTIKEIQDLQRKSIYQDKNGNYVGGAMGKYQIVSGTLQGLINRGVVKPTDMFDEATQDKMAMALLGNSYADYKAGKITADQLQNKVSGIWAGVPNTKGVSTYASDGTNKAKADNGAFLQAIGGVGTETSEVEKQATLERIRRGQVTDSDLGKIQQKAVAGGWGEEFTEALKKGMKTTLTDTQIKGLATVDDKIQKDTVLDNVNLVSQQKETIKGLLNTDINANGFNDIALINAFQKIVDPGVSVKEGDVALLQSGIALKDRLNPSNMLAQVQAGTKLTPETRKQMLDSTIAIYNAQADFGNDLLQKKYYKLADNYGLNLADYGYSYDRIDSSGRTIKPLSEILPGVNGFQSFMSELSNLLK